MISLSCPSTRGLRTNRLNYKVNSFWFEPGPKPRKRLSQKGYLGSADRGANPPLGRGRWHEALGVKLVCSRVMEV